MIIIAPDGTEVDCYVTESGGFVDAIIRADSQAEWEAAALANEILEETTLEDGSTKLVPVPGNNIDVMGSVIVTPGTYDLEGNELTPPVIDTRYHVNLRVAPPALDKVDDTGYPKWKNTVLAWMNFGIDDANPNKNEQGKILSSVTLIDPTSIQTKQRVWL